MFPNSIEKVQEIAYVEGKGYCASFAVSATLFTIPIDKLEPIPLTKEILEKNFPYTEILVWYGNEDKWYIECPAFEDLQVKIEIKYVHQLQHALRLVGIEKEVQL